VELQWIFFLELKVAGTTLGSKEELAGLLNFRAVKGVWPVIDTVLPLGRAREGFEKMSAGGLFGKVVLTA
jgi:D-arabinose 1-dehydrogenase-like Zn-dependent alcohol dehydrogenase